MSWMQTKESVLMFYFNVRIEENDNNNDDDDDITTNNNARKLELRFQIFS